MHLAPPGRTRQWALRVLRLPPAYVATLALLLLAAWLRPQLLSLPLLLLILRQAAPLGLAVMGQSLVMRGGAWMYGSQALRTYSRTSFKPHYRFSGGGFRCARTPP